MEITSTLKALADTSRLRILTALNHGALTVQELTEVIGLAQPTISHHLKNLNTAHLVSVRREGTWAYYTLSPSLPNWTLALLADAQKDSIEDRKKIRTVIRKRNDRSREFFEKLAGQTKQSTVDYVGVGCDYLSPMAAQIPAHGVVVDLGCSSGQLLRRILPRVGETIGVDFSQQMLEQARETLAEKQADCDLRLGFLEHIPVADAYADTVVMGMVLHHVSVPQLALHDARRILKPGGTFILVDLVQHNREAMREAFADLWLGFAGKEIVSWCEEAGFCNLSMTLVGEKKEVFLLTAEARKSIARDVTNNETGVA